MLEYTLELEPGIKKKIDKYIDFLNKVTSVKKMNRILYKCKEYVMKLRFHKDD
jgi:hypothetical protein